MIRLANLPTTPPAGVCLHCPRCGETFSACQGDYFWMPPSKVFRCQHDAAPLDLVRKGTTYTPFTTAG